MRSKRIAYLGVAILFGIVAAGLDAHANADVHGHVYAADTLEPLAGANVQLFFNCTSITFSDTCDLEPSAISTADGSYDLNGVTAGSGTIASSFDTESAVNYLKLFQPLGVDDDTSIVVDLYMEAGASISGRVSRASDGGAVPGVTIQLFGTIDGFYGPLDDTVADSSGNYTFIRLQNGDYQVATENASPYQDQYYAGRALTPPSQGAQVADTITLTAGQAAGNVNFGLAAGAVIEGTLTDKYSGLPLTNLPSVNVSPYDANDPSGSEWFGLSRTVSTDASGHYSVTGLPSVPIRLAFYSESPFYNFTFAGCSADECDDESQGEIFTPSTVAPLTVDASLFPGSVVTGTVVRRSDGRPLAGVLVEAFFDGLLSGHVRIATAVTNAQGHYTLTNIGYNEYLVDTLNAHIDGVSYIDQVYDNQDCSQGNCANIGDTISPAIGVVVPDVDFTLDEGGTISGHILSGDTGLGASAGLLLYASDGSFSYGFATNADGTFETTGLQPGNYYLSASIYVPYYSCIIYPDGDCGANPSLLGQPITIEGTNSVTGIIITFPTDELFKGTFE